METASVEETLDLLGRGLGQLEKSMHRRRGEQTLTVAPAGLADLVEQAQESLASVRADIPRVPSEVEGRLAESVEAVESWRAQQQEHLRERLAGLLRRRVQSGPLVHLVARRRETGAVDPAARYTSPVDFRFSVVPDCGAIPSMSIFFSAVLGFPVRWRKRLVGILLGMPALYVVNVLRLACLAFIGAWTDGGKWFVFAHEYVWQGIYLVFVVGIWLLWMELIVRARRNSGTVPA
jgi:exosortase/archaeosortase family protein